MFLKLAVKNIKRSIKDYAIYFFTLVLGVAIFYVFNALDSQSVMLDVSERVKDMLDLMNVILGAVSVFISVILGALIIYAARFLIKRRGKEFGIYLTLGMGKRKISLILLIETFLIGLLSLAVGLLVGVFASQFTSVIVANMFDANLTEFHFVFSMSAFVKTLIYFGIIYLVVMIFNTIIVSRQKVINLISSKHHNENIKFKNPWLCTIVFVISIITLGIAYYMVTAGLMSFVEEFEEVQALLIPIVMGVVATFLLFWSLSGLLLRIFMSMKKIYYKKLNSFVLRQFSSQINTTVVSMSLICLMLFITICVLGSASSISVNLHRAIERALPADVQVESIGKDAISIEKIYHRENINLNDYLTDIVTYKEYILESTVLSDSVVETEGSHEEKTDAAIIELSSVSEQFIHVGDYNRVAKLFDLPQIELKDNEYAVVANYQPVVKIRNEALALGKQLSLLDYILTPKFDQCIDGSLELEYMGMSAGVIIIPDSILITDGDSYYQREFLLANFKNPEQSKETMEILNTIDGRFFRGSDGSESKYNIEEPLYYYSVTDKQEIIDNNVGTSALFTFVGLYLGIIFLISSAAVLALKQLSESSDNRDKYSILRKLGASNTTLNKALFWQIFIFFIFPLLIAILHSVFGLMFCDTVLLTTGGIDITRALPPVCGLLLLIYGGYFLITYFCSRSMIRERR